MTGRTEREKPMSSNDIEYVQGMRLQAATSISNALTNLYEAQRSIRELTYPGVLQDPLWSDGGAGAAGLSLLAQTIDMAWALRAIAAQIAAENI